MIRHIILMAAFASTGVAATAQGAKNGSAAKEVKFLEDIEVGFGPEAAATVRTIKAASSPHTAAPAPTYNPVPTATAAAPRTTYPATATPPRTVAIEEAGSLHLKYALLLNTEVESVPALRLLVLMDDWWGTRYRLGGNDRSGIDCSGFTCMLYTNLYQKQLPRTAREQFQYLRAIQPAELREGDLVFFANGGSITHVGFYLQNNKFVHASTSEGVTISDLNDRYWQVRFAGAGRYEPGAPETTGSTRP